MIHLRFRISLTIFVVASVLDLCSAAAVDAEIVIPSPPSGESHSAESPSSPAVATTPGFWIVGSHASPQSFDESAPVFCPSVTRYDHCAGFRQCDMRQLTESLLPGVPVCVFCHGSFVSWDDVLAESRETWKWLHHACPRQPIQMIYFSWPSDRPVIFAYRSVRCQSAWSPSRTEWLLHGQFVSADSGRMPYLPDGTQPRNTRDYIITASDRRRRSRWLHTKTGTISAASNASSVCSIRNGPQLDESWISLRSCVVPRRMRSESAEQMR